VFQTPPDATTGAVRTALETGYRLIDTAAAYGNEREAGEAIRCSGLDRDEVFIETKVWISDYGYKGTLHAFDRARASSASTGSTRSSCIRRCRPGSS
jgi:diketogulonate reductase-like aldo/keto reductase